jgi:solute carrier family 25 phosphate transporter 3
MYREEGMRGLVKGWAPTVIGYSLQGFGKFGFYEFFKNFYSNMLGQVSLLCIFLRISSKFAQENTYRYRTAIYLTAGASAEFLADIALAPWEATKVRIQTQDNWANNLREGLPKLYGMISIFSFSH